jgi:DNA-binding MarR family transcriptional regulator
MKVMRPSLPLPTLLSQALVAHTIELDNEAEHRLPHRTTRDDEPDAGPGGPWLVSFALWANVLQYVGGEGITVADLRARARTDQLLLGGLRRWGYVSITAPDGRPLRNPPQDEATVRATKAARGAQAVWPHLPSVIDGRWRERLGRPAVERLERALRAVFDELPVDPPAYLPVIHPAQGGRLGAALPRRDAVNPLLPDAALSPLLSGVLLAFTVDFESASRISLPIGATSLRVLDCSGTRISDLPRLTGVSREANAMCTGWLERHGCAVSAPDPSARRGKVVRLTPKGEKAQQKHRRLLAATGDAWQSTYGADVVAELKAALQDVVGDGTFTSSPLASGLVPNPDNWRAKVRRPETLPHHPMVLHRGGYPDGS